MKRCACSDGDTVAETHGAVQSESDALCNFVTQTCNGETGKKHIWKHNDCNMKCYNEIDNWLLTSSQPRRSYQGEDIIILENETLRRYDGSG